MRDRNRLLAAPREVRFARLGVVLHDGGQRAAEHRRDQLQFVHVGHRALRDRLAVAHHGDAVAQRVQFVEPVRHENHRAAVVTQLAHHGEQQFHFAFVER